MEFDNLISRLEEASKIGRDDPLIQKMSGPETNPGLVALSLARLLFESRQVEWTALCDEVLTAAEKLEPARTNLLRGDAHQAGFLPASSPQTYLQHWNAALQQGSVEAGCRLARHSYYEAQDFAKTSALCRTCQKLQDQSGEAEYLLGLMAFNGQGQVADIGQARRSMVKAADLGHAGALLELALYYAQGLAGLQQSEELAGEFMQKSAEAGNVRAAHNLASIYAKGGFGLEQDFAQAIVWYERASVKGNADSTFTLGFMYEHGEMVEKDMDKAKVFYELSKLQKEQVTLQ